MNWQAIDDDPRFQRLHQEKSRFLGILMAVSIVYYLLLPLGELARGGIEEVPTRAMKSSIGEKFFKKEDDAHRRWKVQRP